MTSAFLDTSFVLALELARDQNHARATEFWQQGLGTINSVVTTDFVFAEVVTFLNSRGHHSKAVEVGNAILQSPVVDFVRVDSQIFNAGWTYLKAHSDKTYSLTDCISFLVMQGRGILKAITFDMHFEQAGFILLPQYH